MGKIYIERGAKIIKGPTQENDSLLKITLDEINYVKEKSTKDCLEDC